MELGELSSLKSLAIQRRAIFRMTFYPEDGIKPKIPGDKSRILSSINSNIIWNYALKTLCL